MPYHLYFRDYTCEKKSLKGNKFIDRIIHNVFVYTDRIIHFILFKLHILYVYSRMIKTKK